MHWIEPSEKDTANGTLEERLWDSADQFRANSGQVKCRIAKCEFRTAGSSSFEIRHSSFANAPSCIVRLLTEIIDPYHGRIVETLRLANVRHAKCRMNLTKPRCALGKRWPCASTSGGMFFSSARFVAEHKRQLAAGQSAGNRPKDYSGEPTRELSIHGLEKTDETGRLYRRNLN